MSTLLTPTDIANRALQRCGVKQRIQAGSLFSEISDVAAEVSDCYNQLRRAELRRNVWRCSIMRAPLRPLTATSMLVVPPVWDVNQTYFPFALVTYNSLDGDFQDGTGLIYQALKEHTNVAPADEDKTITGWARFSGNQHADAWDSTVTYFQGELVYTPSTTSYAVFMSLANDNTATPSTTAPTYDATVTYNYGDLVVSASIIYQSQADLNIANTPASSPTVWMAFPAWSNVTTYHQGDTVTENGVLYYSLTDPNVGNDPTVSTTNWGVWTQGLPKGNWLHLQGAVVERILNPAPLYTGKNVYPLPYGYLREAPQHPKDGTYSSLGAPSNRGYDDWLFEGKYIVTIQSGVILFRHVTDLDDVASFDPMLAEGLAMRIAHEVCEPLTQSDAKIESIMRDYKMFMGEARLVNSIEVGSEEPPLDDYIQTRF